MHKRLFSTILIAVAVLNLAVSASANSVVLQSSKDNTLIEENTGATSNGAGASMFAGRVGVTGGTTKRRAIFMFPIAGNIPSGATITSVSLRLSMNKTSSGATNMDLHKVSASWGEGTSSGAGSGAASTTTDTTWIHRFYNTVSWTTAGGDFSPTISASASVNAAAFYLFGPSTQLKADVQSWVNTPSSNNGWILIGDESTAPTSKSFDTRESLTPANRPTLFVDFTTGAGVDDWAMY